jgi:hypothetical protein
MDKSRMQRLAGIEKTNQLNESFGGYVDIQPLKEMEKESITKSSGWEYRDDEFDQEGGESMYNDDSENPFPSMQDETGDPIQMAIQNLRSMFPGITDADIAEYLATYQEYQSMGDGGEMNEKYKSDAQRKAVWASKNDEENGSKNEAKKGSDKPKDAPRQTGGKGVVGKVSHNQKSNNTARGIVDKSIEKDAREDAKKTELTGAKAMAWQAPHSRVYKENKIKPSSSEFTWDI